jgi:hypothetical protein
MSNEQTGALWLDPDNFAAGGGFMDDVDATIVSAKVDTWAEAEGELFLHVGFLVDGAEEVRTEYYRIGSLEKFTASKDKRRAVPAEGARLNQSVKAALFFKSLLEAGFNKADMTPEVTFLEGLRVHLNNVEMKIKGGDSANFKKRGGKDKDKEGRVPSVVLITKLLDTPAPAAAPAAAPAKAAKGGSAPKAAAPAAAAADTGGAADDVTTAAILEVLGEKNGTVAKRLLPTEMFRRLQKESAEVKSAAMKLVGSNDWLGSGDRPWAFDAGSGDLTLG